MGRDRQQNIQTHTDTDKYAERPKYTHPETQTDRQTDTDRYALFTATAKNKQKHFACRNTQVTGGKNM